FLLNVDDRERAVFRPQRAARGFSIIDSVDRSGDHEEIVTLFCAIPKRGIAQRKAYPCSSCAGSFAACCWPSCHAVVCQLSFPVAPLIHGGSSSRRCPASASA